MSNWIIEVVQDFDGNYYANLAVDNKLVELPEYVSYRELAEGVYNKTGIKLLSREDMDFMQFGKKKYAYMNGVVF